VPINSASAMPFSIGRFGKFPMTILVLSAVAYFGQRIIFLTKLAGVYSKVLVIFSPIFSFRWCLLRVR
jgi:hypothetical protein